MKSKPSFLSILVLIPLFFATCECSVMSSQDADETEVQKTEKRLLRETKKVDLSNQDPALNLLEGDIKLKSGNTKPIGGVTPSAVFDTKIWTTKKIPYVITPNVFTTSQVNLILDAMKAFKNKTCIEFIPRTTETDYISIIRGGGCWSYVGRIGGMQQVSIGVGCEYSATIKHELMHATGFWHEQSRTDRDYYVTVNWTNIQAGMEQNFNMYDNNTIQLLNTTYDIKSIMHYGSYYFAKYPPGLPTITDINGNLISPSNDFTPTDILDLNRLYKCPTNSSIIWTETTWNNGRFMWSSNCDIVGSNIRQVPNVIRENCGRLCLADVNCTHFTWQPNGICTLKIATKLSSATLPLTGAICGYVTKGNSDFKWFDGNCGQERWKWDCDFSGTFVGYFLTSVRTTCYSICISNPSCTSYSVSRYTSTDNRIVCWLKNGKSPVAIPNAYAGDVNALCSMILARI